MPDLTTGLRTDGQRRVLRGTMPYLMKRRRQMGLQSGTTFLDLTKAYEMMRLQDVWQAGCRYLFPPVLLRLLLEAFSFGRYLTYQGAVSNPTHTLSAILAGGGGSRRWPYCLCSWGPLMPSRDGAVCEA